MANGTVLDNFSNLAPALRSIRQSGIIPGLTTTALSGGRVDAPTGIGGIFGGAIGGPVGSVVGGLAGRALGGVFGGGGSDRGISFAGADVSGIQEFSFAPEVTNLFAGGAGIASFRDAASIFGEANFAISAFERSTKEQFQFAKEIFGIQESFEDLASGFPNTGGGATFGENRARQTAKIEQLKAIQSSLKDIATQAGRPDIISEFNRISAVHGNQLASTIVSKFTKGAFNTLEQLRTTETARPSAEVLSRGLESELRRGVSGVSERLPETLRLARQADPSISIPVEQAAGVFGVTEETLPPQLRRQVQAGELGLQDALSQALERRATTPSPETTELVRFAQNLGTQGSGFARTVQTAENFRQRQESLEQTSRSLGEESRLFQRQTLAQRENLAQPGSLSIAQGLAQQAGTTARTQEAPPVQTAPTTASPQSDAERLVLESQVAREAQERRRLRRRPGGGTVINVTGPLGLSNGGKTLLGT